MNVGVSRYSSQTSAYVYMTSHIHLIVTAFDDELQNVIRDFKKFTSKKLIEAIKEHPEKGLIINFEC